MRTLWKIALSFLIWPVAVLAQDPAQPAQTDSSTQSPPAASDSAPEPEKSPELAPSKPIELPAASQTRPLLYFRPITGPPIAPGYFTLLNFSAGYSVTNLGTPSSGNVVLNGTDISITANSYRRIGAKFDLSYGRAPNVFNSGRRMDALTYMAGPVISVWQGDRLSTSVHLLGGGARVAGPFVNASGGLEAAHVHYPAWAVGGGVEYSLSPAFGFRLSVDYLHTHFYNSALAVQGQNDIRVVNSIVYYLGQPTRRHHLIE